jgi:hypothetical protein
MDQLPALENRDLEMIHPERLVSAFFDAEMESCFVLIAQRRVPVKAVQQFGHQADEEKVHHRGHQETGFVAHTLDVKQVRCHADYRVLQVIWPVFFARMSDFETLSSNFETV